MYVCRNEGCPEVFKFRIQRDRHQNMCTFPSHGTRETVIAGFLKCDTGYKCKKCFKVLKVSNSIYKHSKINCKLDGSNEKTDFLCNICGRTFKYKSKLKEHLSTSNKEEKQCVTCNRCFRRYDHFQSHIKTCFLPSMTDMTTQSNATDNNVDEPQAELSDGYTNEVTDNDTNNENEDTFLPIDISVDMLIQDEDSIELVDNGNVWKDSPQELNRKRVQNTEKNLK